MTPVLGTGPAVENTVLCGYPVVVMLSEHDHVVRSICSTLRKGNYMMNLPTSGDLVEPMLGKECLTRSGVTHNIRQMLCIRKLSPLGKGRVAVVRSNVPSALRFLSRHEATATLRERRHCAL